MNKEYSLMSSGNVRVFDENDKFREVSFNDNLEEILVQENIVETIEMKINELEKELKEIYGDDSQKKVNNRKYIPLGLSICLVSFIFPPVMSYFNGNTDVFTTVNNSIFGPINEALAYSLSFSILGVPFGSIIEFFNYVDHKIDIKEFNAKTNELEALRKLLPKEKAKLEKLNSEKTIFKPPRRIVLLQPVNDKKQLDALENFSSFYYNLGHNLDKYHKAFENGTLEKQLQKEGYDEEKITLITNYVKEKSAVFTRKSLKELRTNLKETKVCVKLAKYMTGVILLLPLVTLTINPALAIFTSTFGTLCWGTAWIIQNRKVKKLEREIKLLLSLAKKRVNYTKPVQNSLKTVKQTPRKVQTRILPKKATTYDTSSKLVRKLTK